MTTKLRHAATLLTLSALCGAGLLAVTAQAAPEIVRKAPLQVTFIPDGGARDAGPGAPVKAKLLAIGRYSVLVYTTDKRLVGWGINQDGQLGTKFPASITTPSCSVFSGRCQGPTVIPPPAFP